MALEAINGQQTLIELSERFQVHPNQITEWKKQLWERAEGKTLVVIAAQEDGKARGRIRLKQVADASAESLGAAFFSDEIVKMLDGKNIEFTISVPFERFVELKKMIQGRIRWRHINGAWSYFESSWSPKKWDRNYRFIFIIRQKCKVINKEPIQLDLFIPYEYGYEFKVIVTNKKTTAKKVLMYHNERASQENAFSELKSQSQMDYIAVRWSHGNQMYIMAAIIAHNLNRELQMMVKSKEKGTTEKRSPLWVFEELS